MSNDQSPAPGWYPAPHAGNEQRYWDGTQWLEGAATAQTQAAVQQTTTTEADLADPTAPGSVKKKRNILALISLIVAIVGFVFACIPGALIVGWILLPIAFVLALVSLFLQGRGKALGIAGLIISIVGTIVGAVVFVTVVSDAFDESFGGESSVVAPSDEASTTDDGADDAAAEEDPSSAEGTREFPYALGTTVASDEWEVTINSVTLDATDAVTGENQFNDPPADGNEYILVNATMTYIGDDEEGGLPVFVGIEYVTPTGETVDDTFAVAPDSMDRMSTLYNGGTVTGNLVFEVPSEGAEDGVFAVRPGMLVDTVFFAVQ